MECHYGFSTSVHITSCFSNFSDFRISGFSDFHRLQNTRGKQKTFHFSFL